MENLRYSLFDLFAYTLPGAIVLVVLYFFFHQSPPPSTALLGSLLTFVQGATIYAAVLFVAIAYFTGYITAQLSAWYLKLFKLLPYFEPKKGNKNSLGHSAKYVLVRELARENMRYIETWNVMKSLAANFSLIVLLIGVLYWTRYHPFLTLGQLITGAFAALLISAVLAKEACKYEEWRSIDLDNCLDQFKLDQEPKALLQEFIKK